MVTNVDRGGDVTLHAPGQLIVYPVFNLNNHGKNLKVYMEMLEEVAVDLLSANFWYIGNKHFRQERGFCRPH